MPIISIIMGCYNGGKYLEEAISSIINQTYKNFEFIIVDDGSSDNTKEIVENWLEKDNRVKFISNVTNIGLAASLNKAIDLATGQYIARMDADDISIPNRLAIQLDFLQKTKIDICGAWMKGFGQRNSKITHYPQTNKEISTLLLFQSSFCHPSIMCKASLLKAYKYRVESGIAEDYDLWTRIAIDGIRMGNIPRVLLNYREHPKQVSESGSLSQAQNSVSVRRNYVSSRCKKIDPIYIESASNMRPVLPVGSKDKVKKTMKYLEHLLDNSEEYNLDQKIIANEWYIFCFRASNLGLWTWHTYRACKLANQYRLGWIRWIQLFIACLIKLHYRSHLYRLLERIGY